MKKTASNFLELPPNTLLNTDEAAEVLDLKPATLNIWRSNGRYNLPYIKVGRGVRYRVSDLISFIESRVTCHSGQELIP